MYQRKAENDKVTLWTRQHTDSLEEIRKHGIYRVKREYIETQFEDIALYYIKLYSWFTENAAKIVTKPRDAVFPIWCSISEEYMLRPIKDTVVYVLEVNQEEILYFDGSKWDLVLNHQYIPEDAEDWKQYRYDLTQKGFADVHSFIEGKYAKTYPQERQKVMDSWIRIFDIEDWDPFRVQANIWEIRAEQIKDIIPFRPRTNSCEV